MGHKTNLHYTSVLLMGQIEFRNNYRDKRERFGLERTNSAGKNPLQ